MIVKVKPSTNGRIELLPSGLYITLVSYSLLGGSKSRSCRSSEAFWPGVFLLNSFTHDFLARSLTPPSVVARIALWSDLTDDVMTLTWYYWGREVMIMSRIFAPLVGDLRSLPLTGQVSSLFSLGPSHWKRF